MTNEVLKQDVLDESATSVGLDHHHLVRRPRVNVRVLNVLHRSTSTQGTDSAATAPVAVDVFNEIVARRAFDGDTFVLVRDLNIMYPKIGTTHVKSVKSSHVATTHGNVVELSVGAGVASKVKQGRVNQCNIMNGKVSRLVETQNARSRCVSFCVENVAETLEGTFGGTTEELKVGRMFNEDHVTACCSRPVDDTIPLKSPGVAARQSDPVCKGIVSSRNNDQTTLAASVESIRKRLAQVRCLISFRTIVEDIARLDSFLSSDSCQRANPARELCRHGRKDGQERENRSALEKHVCDFLFERVTEKRN